MKFKLDEDPLHLRDYLLNLMNSLKIVLSEFKQTCMLIMEYSYKEGEEIQEYTKQATWNLFDAFIDTYIRKLIYEYPGNVLEAITILKYQCENMNSAEK